MTAYGGRATTSGMSIDAVIFDLDGVLIDSAEPHRQSWELLAQELGREVSDEQFAATFGRPNRAVVPQLFGPGLSDARVRELGDRKEELYRELVTGRLPVIPGASELVRSCRNAGLKLAVGSSAPPENLELALRELELSDLFDAVVCERDVEHGKPDPQVFLLAAERLGVPPDRCVVLEDAPSGVQAAKTAGMKCVGLTSLHAADTLSAADLVVDSLSGLTPERLQRMHP